MQHEITEQGLLLNPDGTLREPGWARTPVLDYNRHSIKAPQLRIKEWDYYLIQDDEYAVALTLSNLGYAGLMSVSVVDYVARDVTTTSSIVPVPGGKIVLPTTSIEGISHYESKRVSMYFEATAERRILDVVMRKFKGKDPFMAHIELDQIPRDSMMIATPWPDGKHFYFNRKVVGMRASGHFCVGDMTHDFAPENSFGLLDWGRGVWPYSSRWYWGVTQGWQNGRVTAMNLGYGFGDTSAASENMVFVDGICHKLDQVDFGIPKKTDGSYDLMSTWHMTSNDNRLTLDFEPEIDRFDNINLGVFVSNQHQVFGELNGEVVLDDGTVFPITSMKAAVEVIRNKY